MLDVVLDALLDGLKVFPFVLLIYILMEVIEHAQKKERIEKAMRGFFAPAVAGGLGLIPECGFSVMCAKLYDKRLIKIGTLLTAFLATSDEGLVVLVSSGTNALTVIKLIAIKLVYAIVVGVIFNLAFSKVASEHVCPEKDDCIECGEHHEKPWDKYFLHPLTHALKTLAYILVLNLVFGFLMYFIGEENLVAFTAKSEWLQPLLAGIVGMIPSCASSIVLAGAYTQEVLCFGGLLAGLSTNAGLGLIMLFKGKKNIKRNLFVACSLFVTGVAIGYIGMLI